MCFYASSYELQEDATVLCMSAAEKGMFQLLIDISI